MRWEWGDVKLLKLVSLISNPYKTGKYLWRPGVEHGTLGNETKTQYNVVTELVSIGASSTLTQPITLCTSKRQNPEKPKKKTQKTSKRDAVRTRQHSLWEGGARVDGLRGFVSSRLRWAVGGDRVTADGAPSSAGRGPFQRREKARKSAGQSLPSFFFSHVALSLFFMFLSCPCVFFFWFRCLFLYLLVLS